MRWIVRLTFAALLLAAAAAVHAAEADMAYVRSRLQTLFPGASTVDPFAGRPPAARVARDGKAIGYIFSTRAVTGSTGYSGEPVDVLVGLDLKGRITGAVLRAHKEPILVIGVRDRDLRAFVERLRGLDIRNRVAIGGRSRKGVRGIDGVSGASVSSVVIADAVLRSARIVARARGILGGGAAGPHIDLDSFEAKSWAALLEQGLIRRRLITNAEVEQAFKAAGAPSAAQLDGAATHIELFVALMTPAMVGRNLLGEIAYNRLMAARRPAEQFVFIGANGLASFKGTAWRKSGIFERILIVQGDKTIRLRAAQHKRVERLRAAGAPEPREAAFFVLPATASLDPAKPFRLEFLATRKRADTTLATARFGLAFDLTSWPFACRPPFPRCFVSPTRPNGRADSTGSITR